jgi:hypothetical protein
LILVDVADVLLLLLLLPQCDVPQARGVDASSSPHLQGGRRSTKGKAEGLDQGGKGVAALGVASRQEAAFTRTFTANNF